MDFRVLESLLEGAVAKLTEDLSALRADPELRENGTFRAGIEDTCHDLTMLEEWDDEEWDDE